MLMALVIAIIALPMLTIIVWFAYEIGYDKGYDHGLETGKHVGRYGSRKDGCW